jgi:hypothetical protein
MADFAVLVSVLYPVFVLFGARDCEIWGMSGVGRTSILFNVITTLMKNLRFKF